MKYDGGLSLISYNPEFAPMTFTDKQLEEIPVRIIGRVVEERRKFLHPPFLYKISKAFT